MLITAGGRITCQQCSARSKRTKQQCRAPAMKGKKVCRIHGGLSRGPITEAGRLRCAAAKTKHGLDHANAGQRLVLACSAYMNLRRWGETLA